MKTLKFTLIVLCGVTIGFAMDEYDNPYDMSEGDLTAYAIHTSEHSLDPMDPFDFLQLQNNLRQEATETRIRQENAASNAASEAFIRRLQEEDVARTCQADIRASEQFARSLQEEETTRICQQQIRAGEEFARRLQAEEERNQRSVTTIPLAPIAAHATQAERTEAARIHRVSVLERHGHPASEASNWDLITSDPFSAQRSIQIYVNTKNNPATRASAADTLTPIFAESTAYEHSTDSTNHLAEHPQSVHVLDDFYVRVHGTVLGVLQSLNFGSNADGSLINVDEAGQITRDLLLGYGAVDSGTLEASLAILFDSFSPADTEIALRLIALARDLEGLGAIRVITHLLRIPENIAQRGGCPEGRRNRNLLATLSILRDLGLSR